MPSILIVSWNRREYLERTLTHLLADPSDFRLYFWDNGSADGVADIIADLRDERVAARHLNKENSGQHAAWHWFLREAKGDVGGKLDDDILGPEGWMARIADMLVEEPRFGVLGGWVYLPSDWDEDIARPKIIRVGRYQVFENAWVAGCIFLGRLERLRRYTTDNPQQTGTPLLMMEMIRDGMINGYPLPMPFAENLDDPRSPHCRMNRPGGWDQFAALTARIRGFSGPEEYGRWIAEDAREILQTSVADQMRPYTSRVERLKGRVRRGLERLVAR